MILDFLLDHQEVLQRDLEPAALEANQRALEGVLIPFHLDQKALQAFLASRLFKLVAQQAGDRSRGLFGGRAQQLLALPAYPAGESARLLSKGCLLYEHCLSEGSSVCLTDFLAHELEQDRRAARVAVDLLSFLVGERLRLLKLKEVAAKAALERIACTDRMLEHAVCYLHGLNREQAQRLVGIKNLFS